MQVIHGEEQRSINSEDGGFHTKVCLLFALPVY